MTDVMDERSLWREHFGNLHNIGINELMIVNDDVKRNGYFAGEVISREEVES